jgi:hypothetical protein
MPKLSDLEDQAWIDLQKKMKLYEGAVQKQLVTTLTMIRGEMSKIYEKYSKKGLLTKAEMTQYNRYASMEKQILSILKPALKATVKEIQRLMPDMYNESFFHYAWAMDNGTEMRLNWGIQNPKNVMELFDIANPKNIELANALKNYDLEAQITIRNALLKGLSMGKGYASMVKGLSEALNTIGWKALRILRTEGQRAISKGQDDAYLEAQQMGIEGKIIWDATLDLRTRKTHQDADGQEKVDGLFNIGGWPARYPCDINLPAGESINCRCRERFEIDGYSSQLRRSKENGVIPYMKYNEWIEKFNQKDIEV